MSEPSGRTIIGSSIVPFRVVFLMWLAFVADFVYAYPLTQYGIVPRSVRGLIGIITAPLLHGNLMHIVGNTVPMLFLGSVLFYFYNRIALRVFLSCYFITNILVWLFARSSVHIGASGLIYGLAAFLAVFGFIRRDIMSLAISVVVILLYGYLIYGVLPTVYWVSWESHLAGAIVGTVTAIQMGKIKNVN